MVKLTREKKRRGSPGFTSLDFALATAFMAALMPILWTQQAFYADNNTLQAQAQQLAQVTAAAQAYINANESTVEANAVAGGGAYAIPIATLTASPYYLAANFNNASPYGGTYAPLVYRVASGNVQLMVVTVGGQTLDDTRCRRGASYAGAIGGCILSSTPTLASGTGKGWSNTLANFSAAGVAMTAGHVVANGGFVGGSAISNYLSRTVVPGHPEVNQLSANLTGNGYSLTGASALSATGSTSGGQLVPTTQVSAGTSCSPQGAIGQSGTGASLFCNSSLVWSAPTSSPANFVVWW